MGQVDTCYETAIASIMQWAYAEVMPDIDISWPSKDSAPDIVGLDVERLDSDIKIALIEKSPGTVHTKANNSIQRGGVYMYTDVYKWFTETSGLGLAERARKLMDPPVKKKKS